MRVYTMEKSDKIYCQHFPTQKWVLFHYNFFSVADFLSNGGKNH